MITAQFDFSVDLKDEVSPKIRTVKDDANLKKVIKREFFDYFQLDGIVCDVDVNANMKRNQNGIQAITKLKISCKEEVDLSEIKKAIRVFTEVASEKFTLESGKFIVYKIDVIFLDKIKECKPGYSKVGTKCYKDCKEGSTRNSKTMRCRKNK